MRPRLLFIHLEPSSFVREDLRILGDAFDLVPFQFGEGPPGGDRLRGSPSVRDPLASSAKPGPAAFSAMFLEQLLWLLRELPRADGVYGWFSDYHMFLPVLAARLFRKPVAVAIGGFDAISLPSLEYGIVGSRWRWPLARAVLQMADVLLPVSPSLVFSKNRFSEWPKETEQGIRAFVPDVSTAIHVLPTGYDPDLWRMGPPDRDAVVSTVGMIDSDRTLRRKGVDLFFETARLMPDVRFLAVGVVDRAGVARRYDPPANVELLGPVPREALLDVYHASSVYFQLSRAEGLPNVLCEAMLCGCVPVGSRAFGIPEGVGAAGWVVDEPNSGDARDAVRRALEAGPERREAARAHILRHFHLERRRIDLIAVMNRLLDADARTS